VGDVTEDSLRCSVTELLSIFREALIALTPTANRLLLEWVDGRQHRDWERVAETLFDVCVRGPVDSESGRRDREFPLARYDIDVESYEAFSWIGVKGETLDSPAALIRLITDLRPFDALQIAILDPVARTPVERVLLPFAEAEFTFVRRSPGKPDVEIRDIEAID
jgi:hypothetical protein